MSQSQSLFAMISKNLKMIVRAKASAGIIVLGPLLIIFLAGLAFDNANVYAIRIGTYSEKYNDLTNSFIARLTEKQFRVTRFPSEASCLDGIERGEVHTCVVFAPNFAIGKNESNTIDFYVDYSKINLVWTVLSVMTEKIGERTMELSKNLTGSLLSALDYSQKQAKNLKPVVVALTTENEQMKQKVAGITAKLEQSDFKFNPDELGATNISNERSVLKNWIDNAYNVADSSLRDARSYINSAYNIVKNYGPENTKNQTLANFEKSIKDIDALVERIAIAKNATNTEYSAYSQTINDFNAKIASLKSRLEESASARDFSVDELKNINALLDKSLAEIATVQQAIDSIEKVIGAIEITEAEKIVEPITTNIRPVVAQQTYISYLFPTLMVLVILFTALFIAPTLVLLEKNSPAYFRNFMTPTKNRTYLFAVFFSCFAILLLQLAVIIAIAAIFFSAQIFTAVETTAVILVLAATLFTCLGMIIGYVFRSEETAMIASISVGSILLFMSGAIIPIESMPLALAQLTAYNPVVIASDLLRSAILFDVPITGMWFKLLVLFLCAVASFVLAMLAYLSTKRRVFSKQLVRFVRKKK